MLTGVQLNVQMNGVIEKKQIKLWYINCNTELDVILSPIWSRALIYGEFRSEPSQVASSLLITISFV